MTDRRWRTLCRDGKVHAEFSIALGDWTRRRCAEVVSVDDAMGCGPHRVESSGDGEVWRPEMTGVERDPKPQVTTRCEARVLLLDDRFGGLRYQCELDAGHVYEEHRVTFDACRPVASLRWHGTHENEPSKGPTT